MNLVCDPVLASLAPVCIVLSAVDLDNDLLSAYAKVAIVVAVLSGNLEGNNDSTVDLLVLIGKSDGVNVNRLIAITVLDDVCALELKCGKLHGKLCATSITLSGDLAVVRSYGVSGVLGNGVTGSRNYYSVNSDGLTVKHDGVNLLAVYGTGGSSNCRLAAICKSDGLGLSALSEGCTTVSTYALVGVLAVSSGNEGPIAPLVTLGVSAGDNVDVIYAIAVLTLSNSTANPSAGVSVGLRLHRIVLAPNVALSAVFASLKLNATNSTVYEPRVGPLTCTDASLVLCILLLALYVAESVGKISLSVLNKTTCTLVYGVTTLGTGGSYGMVNNVVLVVNPLEVSVATIYTVPNGKTKGILGVNRNNNLVVLLNLCVPIVMVLTISEILTLGSNAKILVADPPVAVLTDVGGKTGNTLRSLLTGSTSGTLNALLALLALSAASYESCTNHEDHHYNCKQFNNVLVHSKISP